MNKTAILPKLVIILGPTASGKTDLGIKLAKEFNGEIISADSRQVYKYMPIGTDMPEGEWVGGKYMVQGVPHYLMSCLEPDQEFTVADFKRQATTIALDIIRQGKIPLVVGGTGLYISALVDNLDIPEVKPDKNLRAELAGKNLVQLVEILKQKDPLSVQVVDLSNPRRVIRALEVVLTTGKSFISQKTKAKPLFDVLQIGLSWPRAEIYQRINHRVDAQIKRGIIDEVKNLLAKGYDWDLPSMSGLGHRQFKDYLYLDGQSVGLPAEGWPAGTLSLAKSIEILKRDTRHYAKRQISWFRRDKSIKWLAGEDEKQAVELVRRFLL